jgi:hypothetical protein
MRLLYCSCFQLKPVTRNSGGRKRAEISRQSLLKYFSVATNAHATTEEIQQLVFLCDPCSIKYSICNETKDDFLV